MWARLIALCARLGFAFARRRLEEESRYEIGAHLDLLVDKYIRSGLTPEVSPWDPRILAVTAVLLMLTGAVAAWLPARRASRVSPRMAIQEGQ